MRIFNNYTRSYLEKLKSAIDSGFCCKQERGIVIFDHSGYWEEYIKLIKDIHVNHDSFYRLPGIKNSMTYGAVLKYLLCEWLERLKTF